MVHVSVGGMRLKGWRWFLPVIGRTLTALRAARRAPGCLHAEIFRRGRFYFNFTAWTDAEAMRRFAHEGFHAEIRPLAGEAMVFFRNMSFEAEAVPTRDEALATWRGLVEAERGAPVPGL